MKAKFVNNKDRDKIIKCSVSCTNTHVTNLVNQGMVKNTKTTFLQNKRILNLCLTFV